MGCGACSSRGKVDKSVQFPSSAQTLDTDNSPLTRSSRTEAVTIKVIQKNRIDVTSLDQIAQDADFSDIVNAAISLEIDTKKISSKGASSSTKRHQKEPQDNHWDEKYFVHGELSDIVADVKSQTHGCINSSISEDIDSGLSSLYEINTKVDAILKDRISKISLKEQAFVKRFIEEREALIGRILIEGRSYADQYEQHYRELLEEFIKKLEIEISFHIDKLQKEIEAERDSVFGKSYKNIERVTGKADQARNEIHRLLQEAAADKRKEIMKILENLSKDKTRQPLGYEQLRTLNLQVYSTVGVKEDGQGCDIIPERQKFIDDINNAKPYQPNIKRTVYLQSDFTRHRTNRNNNS